MLLEEIARTSTDVAGTRSRLAKVDRLTTCLARLATDEVPPAVAYLSGALPQGTIGIGWASLRDLPPPATSASLQLLEVHTALERIRVAAGKGSQAARRRELTDLFARATDPERRFLFGLLLGELRQGALAGVMVDAVARAAGVPPSEVRRALMVAGDLGVVARAALTKGPAGLAPFRLALLRPVQPMLAQTAEDLDQALSRVGPAAVEWKLDGARIQVHRVGGDVRVFTRNLADMTGRVPDLVEAALDLPVETVVLDGEALALLGDGRPHPFQVTMSRFGSRLAVDELRRTVPLSPFFFDCLHLDGEDLIDHPAGDRFQALERRIPSDFRVPRAVVGGAVEARRVLDDALARGHEGVMVKALGAPYEAGRRGASWIKVKRAHTLDLVVLAAEWGHGRRRGWLSNLHPRGPRPWGRVRDARQDVQGDDGRDAHLADQAPPVPRDRPRRPHRPRPTGAGGGGGFRRRSAKPPVPRWPGPPVRSGEGVPAGQAPRRRRHDRHDPSYPCRSGRPVNGRTRAQA
jgi:DNA ligase-1